MTTANSLPSAFPPSDDFFPVAVHWAKVDILDTVGVTLAGANAPAAAIVDAMRHFTFSYPCE